MGLRAEIEAQYRVINGIIQNPGKLEGEPVFVAHFYDEALDHREDEWFIDEEDNHVSVYFPTDAEKKEFPELKEANCIYIWESSIGFLNHATFKETPQHLSRKS